MFFYWRNGLSGTDFVAGMACRVSFLSEKLFVEEVFVEEMVCRGHERAPIETWLETKDFFHRLFILLKHFHILQCKVK